MSDKVRITDPAVYLTETRGEIVRRGWCQGVFKDEDGRVCLVGAMAAVHANFAVSDDLHLMVHTQLRTMTRAAALSLWNDTAGRTVADVLDLIDRAIAENAAKE